MLNLRDTGPKNVQLRRPDTHSILTAQENFYISWTGVSVTKLTLCFLQYVAKVTTSRF